MRLTDEALCSICLQHDPEAKHVDCDAAYDGPVLVSSDTGHPLHTIDDLIVCEPCGRRIAELLDVAPETVARLERELEQTRRERQEWVDRCRSLEDVVSRRRPEEPKRQGPGRPRKYSLDELGVA
jgi:hypothetical protein